MPHSIVKNRVHVIFSTKGRGKTIPQELQSRLWAFMGGIARHNDFAVRWRAESPIMPIF